MTKEQDSGKRWAIPAFFWPVENDISVRATRDRGQTRTARLPSHLEGLCKKNKTKQTDNPNSRLASLIQLSSYLSSENTFLGRKLIKNTLKASLFLKNLFRLRAAPLMKKVGGRHEHPLGHDCGVSFPHLSHHSASVLSPLLLTGWWIRPPCSRKSVFTERGWPARYICGPTF